MLAVTLLDWWAVILGLALLAGVTALMAFISNHLRSRRPEPDNDSATDMALDPKPYNAIAEVLKQEKQKAPKGSRLNPDYHAKPWCPNCGSHALDRQPDSFMLRYCKSCGYYFAFTGSQVPEPDIPSKHVLRKEIDEERRKQRAIDEETQKQSESSFDDLYTANAARMFSNDSAPIDDTPSHSSPDFGGGSFGGGGGGDSYDSGSSSDSGSSDSSSSSSD